MPGRVGSGRSATETGIRAPCERAQEKMRRSSTPLTPTILPACTPLLSPAFLPCPPSLASLPPSPPLPPVTDTCNAASCFQPVTSVTHTRRHKLLQPALPSNCCSTHEEANAADGDDDEEAPDCAIACFPCLPTAVSANFARRAARTRGLSLLHSAFNCIHSRTARCSSLYPH